MKKARAMADTASFSAMNLTNIPEAPQQAAAANIDK
jgi:hypothetical protein